MLKLVVNKNVKDGNKCYQVSGIYFANGKEYKTLFFVYAENETQAKVILSDYQSINRVKMNFQTLANAQTAYKKLYGEEVEISSEEFVAYTKNKVA